MKDKKCSKKAGCGKLKSIDSFKYMPSKSNYNYLCNDCVSLRNKEYYVQNRQKMIDSNLSYRKQNPEKTKLQMSLSAKKRYQILKTKVFDKLGRECSCCGESNKAFLCVDHVRNDGHIHRKEIRNISFGIYNWLVKNNFPDGFQILCHNCNFSKSVNDGICAHKLSERSTTSASHVHSSEWKRETPLMGDDMVCSA